MDTDPTPNTPQSELPASAEGIRTRAEAHQILCDALQATDDAVRQALAERPEDDRDEVVTAAVNEGRIPPVVESHFIRSAARAFCILQGAITPASYSASRMVIGADRIPVFVDAPYLKTIEFCSKDPDTGESRIFDAIPHVHIPDVKGKAVLSDQYTVGLSANEGLDEAESLRREATAAFALATAVRTWQESPQPLPVLAG